MKLKTLGGIKKYKDGMYYLQFQNIRGEIHRDDGGPARMWGHGKTNKVIEMEWWYQGKIHKENGPAYVNIDTGERAIWHNGNWEEKLEPRKDELQKRWWNVSE